MKIIGKIINFKQKIFKVTMFVEEKTDDAWNLYNLINKGDVILTNMNRKVKREGVAKSEKVCIRTYIMIKKVSYDGDIDQLRIQGVNIRENKYINLGDH